MPHTEQIVRETDQILLKENQLNYMITHVALHRTITSNGEHSSPKKSVAGIQRFFYVRDISSSTAGTVLSAS